MAGLLHAHGIGPGDTVVWQLPNWWEALAVAHGVWAAGAIFLVGVLNYFGPTKAGTGALIVAVLTMLCSLAIAAFAFPSLHEAQVAPPAGAPLDHYQVSSPFGVRRDPFHGRLAMHAGIDLTVVSGGEVKARAPGKVTAAGWGGVYGNMVEIDHGFGLRTRYGHLSRVTVRPGDVIKINTTVGHVGSSGRSRNGRGSAVAVSRALIS